MKKSIVLLVVMMVWNAASSQKALKLSDFDKQYQNQEGVIAHDEDYITINVTETGELSIVNNHQQRALYFTEVGALYVDDYIYYSLFNTIENIEAKIFDVKGKSYSVAQVTVQDGQGGGIFFDDNKVKRLVYPRVGTPCQTMLRYTETITDPHFLSKFFFSNYLPTHHRRITFDMPESVQFRYKIFNPTPNIEFAEEHKKGRKIYTWQYRNVPKYTSSSEGFPISYYEPHLIPFLMQYTSNGTVHRVTDSLSDLHRWYYSHIEKIDTLQNNVAIKSFTDSLLQNTKTPLDKMNALYYWVQQNIKYVAIEDGYSGIVPRLPSDVLHRRYGDCKDMAALLFSCLRASSIEAHIAWIGTRDIPYRYSEVASSNSDNHMIVLAQIDNKQYFLDGTAVFLPSNLPSDFIQTKEALVSISRNEYRVVEVPKVAKEENQAIDSSYIDLQGNNLNARGSFTATGYEKFNYAVHLIRSEESKQRELMKAALIKGNNKCEITSLSIKPISSREAPLQVAYTYQVPNYARTVGNDIYVNLQLNRFQQNEKIDTVKCGFGKMIDYQYEKHFVVALTIPVGYTVKSTPTAIDYQNADFGFSSKYRFDAAKNVLYLDNVYTVNCLSVCGQQIAQWNVMLDQITKAYSQVVVLTKK